MNELPVRHTSRLVVLDPANRILLIKYEAVRPIDPARPAERGVWFTPGGGVEAGETAEEAARRELAEETSLDAPIGPCIATRSAVVDIFIRAAFTHERYFLVRAPTAAFDSSRLAETDQDPVLDMRWRTPQEMATSAEFLIPAGLPALYARLLRGDIPVSPLPLV